MELQLPESAWCSSSGSRKKGVEVGVAVVVGEVVVQEVEVLRRGNWSNTHDSSSPREVVELKVDPLEYGGVCQRRQDWPRQVIRPEEIEGRRR